MQPELLITALGIYGIQINEMSMNDKKKNSSFTSAAQLKALIVTNAAEKFTKNANLITK